MLDQEIRIDEHTAGSEAFRGLTLVAWLLNLPAPSSEIGVSSKTTVSVFRWSTCSVLTFYDASLTVARRPHRTGACSFDREGCREQSGRAKSRAETAGPPPTQPCGNRLPISTVLVAARRGQAMSSATPSHLAILENLSRWTRSEEKHVLGQTASP